MCGGKGGAAAGAIQIRFPIGYRGEVAAILPEILSEVEVVAAVITPHRCSSPGDRGCTSSAVVGNLRSRIGFGAGNEKTGSAALQRLTPWEKPDRLERLTEVLKPFAAGLRHLLVCPPHTCGFMGHNESLFLY